MVHEEHQELVPVEIGELPEFLVVRAEEAEDLLELVHVHFVQRLLAPLKLLQVPKPRLAGLLQLLDILLRLLPPVRFDHQWRIDDNPEDEHVYAGEELQHAEQHDAGLGGLKHPEATLEEVAARVDDFELVRPEDDEVHQEG